MPGLFASEVLLPTKSLTGLPGIRCKSGKREVTWVHFSCNRHEIVHANGCLSESLLFGPMATAGLDPKTLREIGDIFGPAPILGATLHGRPVRTFMTVGEVRRQVADKRRKSKNHGPQRKRKLDANASNLLV